VSERTVRGALFIDRDGTLIADAHYLSDATRVKLLPGAAEAVCAAAAVGVPVVVVTNQSGIARGLITERQYLAVRDRMNALLAAEGAEVEATLHCPHWAAITGPCDCRKPGLGMYRQAEASLGIALSQSAYIGDRWRDVQPALALGGVGILVPGSETPVDDMEAARSALSERVFVAESIREAVSIALATLGLPRPLPPATPSA